MLLSIQEGPQLFPNYEKVVQCSSLAAESGDISASDPKSGSANTKLCVTDDSAASSYLGTVLATAFN